MKPEPPSILPRKQKEKEKQRFLIQDAFSYLFKSAGLIIWFVVFALALLEIKQYYHIDLIPGYDSAVDDVYGAIRGLFQSSSVFNTKPLWHYVCYTHSKHQS